MPLKETYTLKFEERKFLAKDVKEMGFPIDEWVVAGEMRLIRLPYSLNGLVSRMVVPVEKMEMESFNQVDDRRCVPNFLKKRLL